MTRWIIWGLILFTTNGFSTLVSRARNTPSYAYHGVCAALNHATWCLAQFLFVGFTIDVMKSDDPHTMFIGWAVYVFASTAGSVAVHYVSINYFETGNRRVGSYRVTEQQHER